MGTSLQPHSQALGLGNKGISPDELSPKIPAINSTPQCIACARHNVIVSFFLFSACECTEGAIYNTHDISMFTKPMPSPAFVTCSISFQGSAFPGDLGMRL